MSDRFDSDEEYRAIYRRLKRGNLTALFGMVLTGLYAVILILYTNNNYGDLTYILGMPHILCVIVAAIFSIVGYYGLKPWGLLTAGVLLTISAFFLPANAKYVIIQIITFIFSYIRKVT